MNGQVWQAGKAIIEIYKALQGTQDGRYGCLPIGVTAKLIGYSCSIPCLHAPKVHSRSDLCGGLGELVVDANGTFKEGPVHIMGSRE